MFTKLNLLVVYAASLCAVTNIAIYTYKTVGDLKIELNVHVPPFAPPPSTGYPVFFAIHGGGDLVGSKNGTTTDQQTTEIMSRGWVLVSINYRLLPGVFLEDIFDDVRDAYSWVRTELVKIVPINIDLITVYGWSAGGGLAVMSGYLLSPRPKAVISFAPFCTNWTDPYSYQPETPVDPVIVAAAIELRASVVAEYIPTDKNDPIHLLGEATFESGKMGWLLTTHDPNFPSEKIIASLKRFSATENVDQNYPPTYLAHGLADSIVPYSQAVQLADKLNGYNRPYVFDLVPGAGHSFPDDYFFWHDHILPTFDFAQKYMQTETTPTTSTENTSTPTKNVTIPNVETIVDIETSREVPTKFFKVHTSNVSINFLEK